MPVSKKEVVKLDNCRACDSSDLLLFLQLGPTPVPNGFLKAHHRHKAEKFYPLDVCFCKDCGLVQLAHVVSPKVMFKNYVYIPSTSETMRIHFTSLTKQAIKKKSRPASLNFTCFSVASFFLFLFVLNVFFFCFMATF